MLLLCWRFQRLLISASGPLRSLFTTLSERHAGWNKTEIIHLYPKTFTVRKIYKETPDAKSPPPLLLFPLQFKVN